MSNRRFDNRVWRWLASVYEVCRREFSLVFHDEGVIIFFLVLCAVYPVMYSLVYNTEVARDVPVVVVDDDRSASTREFARALDATSELCVTHYVANMGEARRLMNEHACCAVLHFPAGYDRDLMRGEQATVEVFCDMGLVLRYKQVLTAVTGVQQDFNTRIQKEMLSVVPLSMPQNTISNEQVALGNTAMGLASAVLPAILVLVLQQSMLLGICMLHGGSRERRLVNRGNDPLEVPAGVIASILGKSLCYLMIYIVPTVYVLHFVPIFFDFPQNGRLLHVLLLSFPFLLATSFMGQALKVFVNDRESTFIAIVFTSVVFVFLSGISWPRYAMSALWLAVGNVVPSTWAVEAYIAIQSNGATLAQQSHAYLMLWVLCGVMFVFAYLVERFLCRRRYRRMRHYAKRDAQALLREEYRHQAVDITEDRPLDTP
ncbi:MAG: ABC transporter permease [Muribaculaceae bacterium]|nr:ABC transporter permease [Muribaculaceae bacterium]